MRGVGIRSVGLTLLGVLACAGGGRPVRDAAPTDPLPTAFRGVTWTTTRAALKASFPAAEIFETAWTCEDGSRCVTFGTEMDGWRSFGRALLQISGRAGEDARIISITAVDPRAACRPEAAPPRPKDCVNEPGPSMDAAFARMRRLLEPQLGKGERARLDQGDRPPRPGERSLRWTRPGYELALHIMEDEAGWVLELQAFRGW